ncbi:MAG: 2-C-methyl-D-erythritol 2,4-cyclodiphosphate synthase [Candidatus Zixiibacteriota bacterium]|nr:MAG: 2-C-methyl-D-erythritol 2,4-cyclodiphosphate synthase [candidate division Zixibacteria bacterium]
MISLSIGHGFDVHGFADERDLILGGVKIPHDRGLSGHSDADVLVHAIMDALLGAAGLPDIGQQFPPTDEAYKDADSCQLLGKVLQLIRDSGVKSINNIDAIIMAEQPTLNPYVPAMREKIAGVLEIEQSRISIKATTTEGLGFVGRGDGIAASAICLVGKDG